MIPVTRSSSDDNAMCYVLTVLWMTSYFHIMELMGPHQLDDVMSSRVRQLAAPVCGSRSKQR